MTLRFIKNGRWVFPVLTGLLLALAYPPFDLPGVLWVALVPLLWFVVHAKHSRTALWGGWMSGSIFFGVILHWFFAAYPLTWGGIPPGFLSWLLVFIGWLGSVILLGGSVGLFAWSVYYMTRRLSFTNVAAAVALWPLLEYARAWLYGFLWWGDGALAGPHWTFGWLSYALADTPFIHLTRLGSSFVLSFGVVLTAFLLLFLITMPQRRRSAGIALGAVFGFLVGISMLFATNPAQPHTSIRTALIQTDVPANTSPTSAEYQGQIQQSMELLTRIALTQSVPPDIIIFAEGQGLSRTAPPLVDAQAALSTLFGPEHPTLVESIQRPTETGNVSQLVVTDAAYGWHPVYTKQLLIPGGEYIPAVARGLLALAGRSHALAIFQEGRTLSRGLPQPQTHTTSHGAIGGLICSGVLSPNLNRVLVQDNAEILITTASYGPLRGHPALIAQSRASAIAKAVENQRFFLQATNAGLSYIIGPNGRVHEQSPSRGLGILSGAAGLIDVMPLATRIGAWTLIPYLLLVGGVVIRRWWR